jgi:hypothetical protein
LRARWHAITCHCGLDPQSTPRSGALPLDARR